MMRLFLVCILDFTLLKMLDKFCIF